jgi:hypothetical protein
VQLLNGPLGDTAIVVVHEREPAGSARVAIGRNHDLKWIADGAEMLPDVCFRCAVREISDE